MKQNISEEDFRKIFSHEKLRKILLIEVESYPLIYYFKNYFIDRILLSKNQDKDTLNSGSKLNNINKLTKKVAFYIKCSLTKNRATKDGVDVLFFSFDRFVDIKTQDGKMHNSDYLFSQVIRELNSRHPDYKIALVVPAFRDLPNLDYVQVNNLFQYSTPLTLIKSVLFSLHTYLRWRFNRIEIVNHLKDNDFENVVPIFDIFFTPNRLFYSNIFDRSLKNYLNEIKPKVILANNEALNLKPRTNLKNMKFCGIQASKIYAMHEKYNGVFISNFQLDEFKSDLFLVSGIKFKDMKKNTKDTIEIIVVGQHRYDVLSEIANIYDIEQIYEELVLDQNKKIILWTTQTHGLPLDENLENISAVYSAVQLLNDVQLIVKLHPAENQKGEIYKANTSFKPIIVPGNIDIYSLLYMCDLLITKNSTTAMEAVALNKPVVILNLSGEPLKSENYVNEGVALGVNNAKDLKQIIFKLLKDDSVLVSSRDKYIENYLYKNDGKASERVVSLIGKIINQM